MQLLWDDFSFFIFLWNGCLVLVRLWGKVWQLVVLHFFGLGAVWFLFLRVSADKVPDKHRLMLLSYYQ